MPARLAVLGGTLVIVAAVLFVYHGRLPAAPGSPVAAVDEIPVDHPTPERQALLPGLFHGALTNVADGIDFAESPRYFQILSHVLALSPEEFHKRVAGSLDWAAAVEHPDEWRGEFVTVRGLAFDNLHAEKLHGSDAGLSDVYRGFIGRLDGTEAVAFDCVEPPARLDFKGEVVDIEGIFYRTVKYEARDKDSTVREVPYLIVRNLSPYEPPGAHEPLPRLLLKIGAVVLASLLLAFAVLRWTGRRRPPPRIPTQPAGFRELFEARLREDQQRPQGQAKPEPRK